MRRVLLAAGLTALLSWPWGGLPPHGANASSGSPEVWRGRKCYTYVHNAQREKVCVLVNQYDFDYAQLQAIGQYGWDGDHDAYQVYVSSLQLFRGSTRVIQITNQYPDPGEDLNTGWYYNCGPANYHAKTSITIFWTPSVYETHGPISSTSFLGC